MFRVGYLRERVDERGVGVRHQEHVGLLDLLEAADGRAVEADPVLEDASVELRDGDREVLHQARQVAEAEVDDLRPALLQHGQDVLG